MRVGARGGRGARQLLFALAGRGARIGDLGVWFSDSPSAYSARPSALSFAVRFLPSSVRRERC